MSDFPCAFCSCCGTLLTPMRMQVSVEGVLERSWFACPTCDYSFDLSGEICKRAQRVQQDHHRRITDLTNRGVTVQHGRLVMNDGSLDMQLAIEPGQTLYLVGGES